LKLEIFSPQTISLSFPN